MSPRLVAETRAAALLDDRERVEALDEACALVPRVAHPGLAARFVAALVSQRSTRRGVGGGAREE